RGRGGEVGFEGDDLGALRIAGGDAIPEVFDDAVSSRSATVHQTRVMSAAMARIAEQSTDDLANVLGALRAQGVSDDEIARLMVTSFQLDRFEQLLWYMFRRQWRGAAGRGLAPPPPRARPPRRGGRGVCLVVPPRP